MNAAIEKMLAKYACNRSEDSVRALREIMQEIALLGLWRSKFFEQAAFYGGTALRILYGLDRFSEDLDFSLLAPRPDFDLKTYSLALERELAAFGFNVTVEKKEKDIETAVQSAFLKANTINQLLVIDAPAEMIRQVSPQQTIRIKVEVDTDPPKGFNTESKYLLQPIPFSVKSYVLPDLFAGKMHALLCRQWKNRVKGRDWYDLTWYCAHYPLLHLTHLEERMRQSGHYRQAESLSPKKFLEICEQRITEVDIGQAKIDVLPFLKNPEAIEIWSKDFFRDIIKRLNFLSGSQQK